MNINKKVKNLEFRWTKSYGLGSGDYPEIVFWKTSESGKDYCYTVARWEIGGEGWELKFVGSRPFNDEIDKDLFWKMIKFGDKVSNAFFELTEDYSG